MIAFYLIFCYFITGASVLTGYFSDADGEITYADIIMFLLAPFAAIPVAVIFLGSLIVDLDKAVFKK